MAVVLPNGFEAVNCPGCGSERWANAYTGKDWILQKEDPIHVVQCKSCGLHFVNPRPTREHIGEYYPNDYEPHRQQRGEVERDSVSSTWFRQLILKHAYGSPQMRPRSWQKILAAMVCTVRSPKHMGFALPWRGQGRLLDFGCGNGTFLRRMAMLGWDVTGLDFSPLAVDAVKKSGLRAIQGTLPNPELAGEQFDVITMRHALEHVPQPREVLQTIFNMLSPGGLLHIQVPNFASWEVEHFGEASHILQLPRHLLQFTPQSLQGILERCGFKPVQVRQECRAGWLRKCLDLKNRKPLGKWDHWLKNRSVRKWVAWNCQRRGMGNELIASAIKSA